MNADQVGHIFKQALATFGPEKPLILTHNDADGLSAGALLARTLAGIDRPADIRVVNRGENPWSVDMAHELAMQSPAGIIVADLGMRAGAVRMNTPTVVIDHHVPTGSPGGATVISSSGADPTPTTSLLAWWCAAGLKVSDDLLWLAAIGLIGDLGDRAPFQVLAEAKKCYGATVLREAVSLLNAPRRAARGDAAPAMALLMKADGPRAVISGEHPETAFLIAARTEVKQALEAAKRVPPKIKPPVALIRLHSPCQIHPLVAQAWKARLKDNIVMVANTGYRAGWIHFSMRSATGRDLVEFLRDHAPDETDEQYGSGHQQATGGALRPAAWNAFIAGLGFAPEMQVAA
jgi:single-stranded-DNA-specific exonuclease